MAEDDTKKRLRMKAYNARPEVRERTLIRQRADRLTIEGRARWLTKSARHRALKDGMEFNLTWKWVAHHIEHCVCPYTMQPFALTAGRHPFGPSLDRTDNDRGYTTDNVSVVSFWWNIAKNNWPPDVIAVALSGLRVALQGMEFGP